MGEVMIRGIAPDMKDGDGTFTVPIEDAEFGRWNGLWKLKAVPSMESNMINLGNAVYFSKLQLLVDGEVIDEWTR